MCRCSPEYAVDDEVDAAVDGHQEVVGLRQGRELRLPEMLKHFLLFTSEKLISFPFWKNNVFLIT